MNKWWYKPEVEKVEYFNISMALTWLQQEGVYPEARMDFDSLMEEKYSDGLLSGTIIEIWRDSHSLWVALWKEFNLEGEKILAEIRY